MCEREEVKKKSETRRQKTHEESGLFRVNYSIRPYRGRVRREFSGPMSVRGEAVDVSFWPIKGTTLQGCLFLAGVGADLRGLEGKKNWGKKEPSATGFEPAHANVIAIETTVW